MAGDGGVFRSGSVRARVVLIGSSNSRTASPGRLGSRRRTRASAGRRLSLVLLNTAPNCIFPGDKFIF